MASDERNLRNGLSMDTAMLLMMCAPTPDEIGEQRAGIFPKSQMERLADAVKAIEKDAREGGLREGVELACKAVCNYCAQGVELVEHPDGIGPACHVIAGVWGGCPAIPIRRTALAANIPLTEKEGQ